MTHYKLLKRIFRISSVCLLLIAFLLYFIGNWNMTIQFPPLSLIFTEIFAQLGDFSNSEAGNAILLWIYVIVPITFGTLFVILNYKRNTTKQGVLDAILSVVIMFTLLYFQSYFWSYVSRDFKAGINITFQVITFVIAMLSALVYLALAAIETVWFFLNRKVIEEETTKRRNARKPTYVVNPIVTHSPAFDKCGENTSLKERDNNQNVTNSKIDNLDLLLKYKQLLDAGAISQEEYDTKKSEILGK